MPESRTLAVTVPSRAELLRAWTANAFQAAGQGVARLGAWTVDTAQQIGSVVSAFMGPAIVSAYAFAAWSFAASFGWTDSFLFTSGPFANWFVWLGLAVLVHAASGMLRRRTRSDD